MRGPGVVRPVCALTQYSPSACGDSVFQSRAAAFLCSAGEMAKWCSAVFLVGLLIALTAATWWPPETFPYGDLFVSVFSGTGNALGESTAPPRVRFVQPSLNYCLAREPVAGSNFYRPVMSVCDQSSDEQKWLYDELAIHSDDNKCLTVCVDDGALCIPSVDPTRRGVNLTDCVVAPSRPGYQLWKFSGFGQPVQVYSVSNSACLTSTSDRTLLVDRCVGGFYQTWEVMGVELMD